MRKLSVMKKLLLCILCLNSPALLTALTAESWNGKEGIVRSELLVKNEKTSNKLDLMGGWIAGCKAPKRGPPGCQGPAGPIGPIGLTGPVGPAGSCSCSNGCVVGMTMTFFGTDFPTGPVFPDGSSETFGPTSPVNQSLTVTAFDLNGNRLTLFNKNEGFGEQGVGIVGLPDNEITTTNFIQIDLINLLSMNPPPKMIDITLTIQSIQANEGFAIYQSNTSGVLGTFVASSSNPPGTTVQTIPIPLTGFRYLNITATMGDVLLSSLTIPQCEMISSPLLIVVDPSIIMPSNIPGSFIGQLAFFQNPTITGLYVWDGTVWIKT